jgi:hypothetical protein
MKKFIPPNFLGLLREIYWRSRDYQTSLTWISLKILGVFERIGSPTYPNWFHQLWMRSWCSLFFSTTVLLDNILSFWSYLLLRYFHCWSLTGKRSTTVFTLLFDSQLSHCLVHPHSSKQPRLRTFWYALIRQYELCSEHSVYITFFPHSICPTSLDS